MKTLLPPGWPRQRLCERHRRARSRHRHRGVIGWNDREEIAAADLPGQLRQVLLNTLAVLAVDGAGPSISCG